jgi:hypothetical protein
MSQNANTLDNSYLVWRKIILPPNASGGAEGQTVSRDITGKHFMVIEQSGGQGETFWAGFDDRPLFKASLGLVFRLSGQDFFSKLRFRNDTLEEMVIEIYAGTVETEDMRLNIVRGRAAPVMEAESVITTHSTTIAGGAEVDLTVLPPPGPKYIRKATIVFNMDPAVDLDLADEDDNLVAPVLFRQGINYPSSEGLKVQNPSGAPIVARISQVWYVVN